MPQTRRRWRGYHSLGSATYIDDRFGGAAATLAGRTPDTVGATTWSVLTGTISTDGTKAICSTGGQAIIESGHADCSISLTVVTVGGGDIGICFRAVDSLNYWYWIWQPGFPRWTLTKVIANAGTPVITTPTTPALVNGDVIKVVPSGNNITGLLNGAQLFTTADAQFNTATKHGLISLSATSQAWDNFLVAA